MSCQVGALHRSIDHPANLQSNLPIIPLFAFHPPQSNYDITFSSMESDTKSNTTVYYTVSQFNNSDIKTPDKITQSEPSPSIFSQPPFQPFHSQVKIEPSSPPTPISNTTPLYFSLTSEPSDNNSSVNTQLSPELDNLITLQQQLQHPQTLTIQKLSQPIISSNSLTPTPTSHYTPSQNPTSSSTTSSSTNRAYRTFKRKFPNTPFPSNPGASTTFFNHPLHTNTEEYLQRIFPQYTYFHSDPNDDNPNYVNEHVL